MQEDADLMQKSRTLMQKGPGAINIIQTTTGNGKNCTSANLSQPAVKFVMP